MRQKWSAIENEIRTSKTKKNSSFRRVACNAVRAKPSALQATTAKYASRFRTVVPPVNEQHEIVRRVDALFTLADKIADRVQGATMQVERITQAILAKAFRGELVPTEAELARAEGRDYEPAAKLLERIAAERANGDAVTPSKRSQKGKRVARKAKR
jgi:hypothetical protein